MINYRTYCAIKDLRLNEHLSMGDTARQLALSRQTVQKYDKSDYFESTARHRKSTVLNGFKGAILEELALTHTSAATIFKRIQSHGFKRSYSAVSKFIAQHRPLDSIAKPILPGRWILMLLQGAITSEKAYRLLNGQIPEKDVDFLLNSIRNGRLHERNYALSVLSYSYGLTIRRISRFLMISRTTAIRAINLYHLKGLCGLSAPKKRNTPPKLEQAEYKDALFRYLHSPPRDHGINRTTWTIKDLCHVMSINRLAIDRKNVRLILKNAGFRLKKAKKVLTSTDPDYREKRKVITEILAKLSEKERFFSIDESGPVAVKIHGGTALTAPGDSRVVPQIQKTRGQVLLVGALELSSNQMTHFYAKRKSTIEMMKLMHILLNKYIDYKRIYLSWDSASWHGSKRFLEEIDRVNAIDFRSANGTPEVCLAPLPACAQFLNVIESVFSGMARAIIHNRNYDSVEECKKYIDRYLQ